MKQRKLNRIKGAQVRQEARAKRSPQHQLDLLDKRPGEAKLEKARLLKLVSVKPEAQTDTPKKTVKRKIVKS